MLIGDIVDVFRKGKSVANPALWQNIGASSAAIAGLLTSALAVAAAFGYSLDISDPVVQALAYGIAGVLYLLSVGVHITTSDKVGLPAKRPQAGTSDLRNPGPDSGEDQHPREYPGVPPVDQRG